MQIISAFNAKGTFNQTIFKNLLPSRGYFFSSSLKQVLRVTYSTIAIIFHWKSPFCFCQFVIILPYKISAFNAKGTLNQLILKKLLPSRGFFLLKPKASLRAIYYT